MNRIILVLLFLGSSCLIMGQGAGFGYQLDLGYKNNFSVGEGYSQSMQTINNSFFVRWHTKNGRQAHQLINTLRIDSIGFTNTTSFLSPDGETLESFEVDAYLKRIAWRFGYIKQHQIIGEPGKFVLALNYGGFYEFTSQMKRKSEHDNIEYKLYSEQNRHNIGINLGIEARLWFFTIGYKFEHMFFDMINHEYLKTQQPGVSQGAELRGLELSPSMSFIYFSVHLDFFNSNQD